MIKELFSQYYIHSEVNILQLHPSVLPVAKKIPSPTVVIQDV